MDDPDFPFHKNELFNIAICKKCQYGVISSRIEHHILDKHENETEESAKHIAEIVSTWNVRDDRNITYSNNAVDQQEHLPLYKETFRCNQCNYFSRGVYKMRAHCRDRHKWNPYESKNGRLRKTVPWREHVHCQNIFPVSFGQFFEVKANAINEDLVQQAATLDPDFLFHKNDLFNVAICKKCQYGIFSARIARHISERHEEETKESARNIAEIVSTWNVRSDNSITYPNNAIDQQEHLPLYSDAFKCNECKYICRDFSTMRAHCRDQHNWNPYESKTARLEKVRPWREHIYCQNIFPKRSLFEVKPGAVNEDLAQQAATDPDFLFHKNDLFNVAICKQCQHGVVSVGIRCHIQERHANETLQSAKRIVEIVSTWKVRNDKSIRFSNNAIDQQEHLPLYHDGLACKQCTYICRTIYGMRKHCKDKHETSRKGRSFPWRKNVLCQQIFGLKSTFFEVRPKVAVIPELSQSPANVPTDEDAMELVLEEDSDEPESDVPTDEDAMELVLEEDSDEPESDVPNDMDAMELVLEDDDDLAQKVWDSTISTLTKAYRLGIHLREKPLLLNLNEAEDRFVTEEHTFEQVTTCFASLMVFFVRARNVRFTSRQLADWNNYKRLVKHYQHDDKEDISNVEEACTRFCISLLDDQGTGNSETTLVKAMTCNGEPEFTVLLGWLEGARWMVLNFAFLEIDKIKQVYPDVGTTRPQELLEIFAERFVNSATAMRWLLDQIETIGAS